MGLIAWFVRPIDPRSGRSIGAALDCC